MRGEKYFAQNDYKMPSTSPAVVQPTETKVGTRGGDEVQKRRKLASGSSVGGGSSRGYR